MGPETAYPIPRVSGPKELQDVILETVDEFLDSEDAHRRDSQEPPVLGIDCPDCLVIVHNDNIAVPTDRIGSEEENVPLSAEIGSVSADAFESILEHLIHQSYLNGIDIQGSWSLRTAANRPDWEVEITEVTKPVYDV